MVRRLVGYWEYLQALQNLDRLASTLSKSERDELDEYVRQRKLFAVEGNLSKQYQVRNTSLTDPKDVEEEHRGLDWMTSLARVELGAMLSGYTKVPRPFESVKPTASDIDAYRYLLLDAVRSHYWSLKNDPAVSRLLRSKNIYHVLSYSRRVSSVRSMIESLARSRGQWTVPEQQELKGWKSELDELSGMFAVSIRNYLRSQHAASRTSTSSTSKYLSLVCRSMLEGERRELRSGVASQSSYDWSAEDEARFSDVREEQRRAIRDAVTR